ncbi:hypothetical protein M422DRAFT_71684, partial [Sphaerobolus stellatus SS14]
MSKATPGRLSKKPTLGERLRPGAAIRKKSGEFLTDLGKTMDNYLAQATPDDPVHLENHQVFQNNQVLYNKAEAAEKNLSFMARASGGAAVADVWSKPYTSLQKAKDERKAASEEALRQRNQVSGVLQQHQHLRQRPTENATENPLGGHIIPPEELNNITSNTDATSSNDGFRFAPMPTPTSVTKRVEVDDGLKPGPGRRRVGKQP